MTLLIVNGFCCEKVRAEEADVDSGVKDGVPPFGLQICHVFILKASSELVCSTQRD